MATSRLAGNLSQSIQDQDDPETVRAGAPAYLLLLDGLIEGDPDSAVLLLAGSRLYGAYATIFVEDRQRAGRLATKSLDYARRALCIETAKVCGKLTSPFPAYTKALAKTDQDDAPTLFAYAASWSGWIQANSSDWNALAEIPKAKAMMQRVVELQPSFENGLPQLYLGVMNSQIPPALGGRPEEGRAYFERAIALSNGQNLMAKVQYAQQYARLVFDKDLHDRLLTEVLQANPYVPGLTLTNILAQRQAHELLATSNEYF